MKRYKIVDGESTSVRLGSLDGTILVAHKMFGTPRKITYSGNPNSPTASLRYKGGRIVRIIPNGDVSAKRRRKNPPAKPAKYKYGACPNEQTRGKVQKHSKGTPSSVRIA